MGKKERGGRRGREELDMDLLGLMISKINQTWGLRPKTMWRRERGHEGDMKGTRRGRIEGTMTMTRKLAATLAKMIRWWLGMWRRPLGIWRRERNLSSREVYLG